MNKIITLFSVSVFTAVTTLLAAQPTFQWAKKISGPSTEQGFGITVDANGNIYHCGVFNGTVDFDLGAGTTTLTALPSGSGYLTKYDASGNLSWANALPGNAYKVTTDVSGNVFVSGAFNGTQDFDPGSGILSFTAASTNSPDMYIAKYDNSGNFIWAGQIAGIDYESPKSLTTDVSGNLIIAGIFKNAVDFNPSTTATHTLASSGQDDGYVLKLDNSGNFLWVAKFGSSVSYEETSDVVTDAAGNIYATGVFGGTVDFDPGAGLANLSSPSSNDVYIVKLDAAGNFGWAKSFGSFANDESRAIAIDGTGNLYIAGAYAGTTDFDPSTTGTATLTSVGGLDCFIAKYDAAGNYIFAKGVGSVQYDACKDIKVSSNGNIYYTGIFYQTTDFDPSTSGTYTLASAGANDDFISALDASGNFLWAGSLSPWSYDIIDEIALSTSGDFYASGTFMFTTDFDISGGVFNLSSAGSDAFMMKLGTGTAGIKENNSLNSYVIAFPNPAKNNITIQTKDVRLQQAIAIITDITGREIERINMLQQDQITVDLSNYKDGMYFYQLQQDNKIVASGKIIKQ